MTKIPLSFYEHHDVVQLSRDLIGKYLFTCLEPEKVVTGGMIIETEAYRGVDDRASHAYNNKRTPRTEVMFSKGGVAYIYFCYGIHHLFNVVTNKEGVPHAVLIRAIQPEVGVDVMVRRRGKKSAIPTLTSGPGSVCQALGMTRQQTGISLTSDSIWLEDRGVLIPDDQIQVTPRIGVDYAKEDAFKPWRFVLSKL